MTRQPIQIGIALGLCLCWAAGCRLGLPEFGETDAADAAAPQDAGIHDAGGQDAGGQDAALVSDGTVVQQDAHFDASLPDAAVLPDAATTNCNPSGPQDCSQGPGTGNADQCFDTPSCYLTYVQQAVNNVIQNNPTWFGWNDAHNCPLILDINVYMDAVVNLVAANGVCVIRDPNDPDYEITVKYDNDFAENFRITASWQCPRYGAGIYMGACIPAWW